MQIGPRAETAPIDLKNENCTLIIDDGETLKRATDAGAGIAINSLWSVRNELDPGHLIHVLPTWLSDERSVLWLVHPKSNILSANLRDPIAFLIERIDRSQPRPPSASTGVD